MPLKPPPLQAPGMWAHPIWGGGDKSWPQNFPRPFVFQEEEEGGEGSFCGSGSGGTHQVPACVMRGSEGHLWACGGYQGLHRPQQGTHVPVDASPQWQRRPHLEQMRLLAYFWQRGDEAQPGSVCVQHPASDGLSLGRKLDLSRPQRERSWG